MPRGCATVMAQLGAREAQQQRLEQRSCQRARWLLGFNASGSISRNPGGLLGQSGQAGQSVAGDRGHSVVRQRPGAIESGKRRRIPMSTSSAAMRIATSYAVPARDVATVSARGQKWMMWSQLSSRRTAGGPGQARLRAGRYGHCSVLLAAIRLARIGPLPDLR